MPNPVTPQDVKHSDMTANLGDDWIAVSSEGHVLTRASDEASARQAVPDAAAYYSAKDLHPKAKVHKTADDTTIGTVSTTLSKTEYNSKPKPEDQPAPEGLGADLTPGASNESKELLKAHGHSEQPAPTKADKPAAKHDDKPAPTHKKA